MLAPPNNPAYLVPKYLILGSTVAALAASSASAADVIIAAEPEPVEYVRVCDAFGSGYFYIPGTETCLRFSGLVRMRVFGSSQTSRFTPRKDGKPTRSENNRLNPVSGEFKNTGADSYSTSYRARLTIDAKSDTELGELHARLRFQGDSDSNTSEDANAIVDQAYLQLGGLFAGYSESAWVYSTNGGASGFGGKGIYDGNYGYQQRNMLQYQFSGSDFFAVISLEDDNDSTSWSPDIVGRVGGAFGDITVFGVVAYDQSAEKFGAKLGLNTDIGSAGNFILQGFYASGHTNYSASFGYVDSNWTPEWSVLAAYGHDITETINAYVNGQYFSDFYNPVTNASSGIDAWSVSGGFKWSPVTNFSVTAEARYYSVDTGDYFAAVTGDRLQKDWWQAVLQLQRDF